MEKEKKVKDVDFADSAVPSSARKNVVTMFMIMLGFTFFSASMWVGQQLADGLDFWGFLGSLILGGIILGIYTGLLGYVGAKTGLSLDLLSQRAFGEKGSYLPSAMTSFTQIGWFGVGLAMFAIPVSKELLGGSTAAQWGLVILAGVCMTASAYFGIESLTIVSYIAVPSVAILGTIAMVMAVMRGDGTIIDQFAKSSGSLRCRSCHRLLRFRRNRNPELRTFCKGRKSGCHHHGCGLLHRKLPDVLLRCRFLDLCRRKRYLRGYGPPEPVLPGCSRSRS